MKLRQYLAVLWFDPFAWVLKRFDPELSRPGLMFVARNAWVITLRLYDVENRFRMVLRRRGLTVKLRHPPTPIASGRVPAA